METEQKLSTEAEDDDMRWIGRETVASSSSSNITFRLSKVSQRMKAKNTYWSRKYKTLFDALKDKNKELEEANRVIEELRAKVTTLEANVATLEANVAADLENSFINDTEDIAVID
jgi:DNA repair ATPase RecN